MTLFSVVMKRNREKGVVYCIAAAHTWYVSYSVGPTLWASEGSKTTAAPASLVG